MSEINKILNWLDSELSSFMPLHLMKPPFSREGARKEYDQLRKENEQLKEGIKEGLEFINDTSLWEINSYNTGEIYMRCRFCLADYKYGHNEYCPAKIYIERWKEL